VQMNWVNANRSGFFWHYSFSPFLVFKKEVHCDGGVYWTKFECFSSKIQMIKNTNADEARRNNISGVSDSPCRD